MNPSRFAALLGGISLALLLSGCGPGRLHILIPDFQSSSVDGLRIFRVAEANGVQAAGRIEFGPIVVGNAGLEMEYTQVAPGKDTWGPLTARVKQRRGGQLELELAFFNPGAPAFFKFASYNRHGTSPLAEGSIYVAADPAS
jgi:hypothetical protein